ncbi:MAG: hypothetical protein HKN92_08825 [Chitinophagales bacterium]|nr:hypothetical protein [Chitinophagales bacterium]
MCTVTYLPLGDGYILTSNRDESPLRGNAIPPKFYEYYKKSLLYPKDPVAEGSWIVSSSQFTLCLLNGGFEKHERQLPYRMSRGRVLLDFFSFSSVEDFFKDYSLDKIEPFTLVILKLTSGIKSAYELVWDGNNKHIRQLNPVKPFILASSTLYDRRMRFERKSWFSNWLNNHSEPFNQKDIIEFHKNAGNGNPYENLQMNRDEKVKTLSITSVLRSEDINEMKYINTSDLSEHQAEIPILQHFDL